MPLPSTTLVHMIFGGAASSVGDTWNAGFWLDTNPNTLSDANAAAASALTQFMTTFWNNAANPWKAKQSDGTSLDFCKLYEYSGGILNNQGVATQSPSLGTNSGGASGAYQACCVSLLTAKFGRSYRGRMYLPWTAPLAHATCQFTTITAEITNLKTFFDYWPANAPTGWGGTGSPTVVSRHLGVQTHMTKFRIDSNPDTQHGRNRKATPTFSVTTTL